MRKINILLVVLMIASALTSLATSISTVQAETNETELTNIIDENYITLSYQTEVSKNRGHWLLKFNHQAQEKTNTQRLKFKITDEKEQTIAYPVRENLLEKAGWLIERNFSRQSDGQLAFDLPETTERLYLSVQLEQQSAEGIKELIKQKEPYVLELKNTMRTETSTSEKQKTQRSTGITKISSTEFVGPKQAEIQATSVGTAKQMYSPLYTNKVPQYKTDNSGTYPEFSWKPEGQDNVLNHQGGNSNQLDWDNVKSWDVTADDHTQSYIKYGEDSTNPNIRIRKYAQQTDKPDEFKIKLNVKGNISYEPGVDLVFLLDNSFSMLNLGSGSILSRKENTEKAFKKIIDKLQEDYPDNQGGIRIGSHTFSDYEPGYWGETASEKMTFPLTSNHTEWDKMVSEYDRAISVGSTFTQRGLREAADIFLDAPDIGNRYKLLFVLTDGAPNRSWIPKEAIPDSTMYYDPYDITSFTNTGSKGEYNYGSKLGADANLTKFPLYKGFASSHITTTNSTAKRIKENEGIEIHTIGVDIKGTTGDHPTDELKKGLYRMSTKKANTGDEDEPENYFYYDVSNSDELSEVFNNWYETIIRTVDGGIITDPLGDMVDMIEMDSPDQTVKITQVNNGAAEIDNKNMPIAQLKDNKRTIDISNINLTSGQEIEIEYTVKLRTNDPDFVSSQWYPTNKTTTLKPTPERTNDSIEFGSPSIRFKKLDFVIPVKKLWVDAFQETENYWEMRNEKVTTTLQELNGSDWKELESIDLDEANKWEGKFSPVEGGKENVYRVIEPERTLGYKAPTINQESFTSETIATEGIEMTNELLKTGYSFNKFMEDGRTPFLEDLPRFQIVRKDGKVLAQNITPTNEGNVLLPAMPLGEYTVEETYVPKGFQKMADFVLKVTENAAAEGLVVKVNNQTDSHTAINKLKDFSLKLKKVDPTETPLAGASFTLTGPNYEMTKTDGPEFTFMELRPGSYTLTEVESPEGYQRIKEPIQFDISINGKVTIVPHSEASGSESMDGEVNTINLKVINKRVRPGVLPNTGRSGIHKFYIAAAFFMSVGILLSGAYVYHDKRK
ncbi:SpaA isopeptide-forming pilin-related protein [Enterococcus sp. DIV0756]|uniref:SpaA isopeptide-forming pilin-related protein n=1 Tax=Enterococcus sp. DIV0756 TaxID=2774636 RepID=UPI003F2082FE